jgi:hypothetical protein
MERTEQDNAYRPLLQQHVAPADYSSSGQFSGYHRARRPSKGVRSTSSQA